MIFQIDCLCDKLEIDRVRHSNHHQDVAVSDRYLFLYNRDCMRFDKILHLIRIKELFWGKHFVFVFSNISEVSCVTWFVFYQIIFSIKRTDWKMSNAILFLVMFVPFGFSPKRLRFIHWRKFKKLLFAITT